MTRRQRPKLAITGGPSGGKTSLLEALKKEKGPQILVVPEAATILFRGGFPRKREGAAVERTQRAIFFVQQELEKLIDLEKKGSLVICDRGSLDGVAYWPGSEESFFKSLNTNIEAEIARYDFVLHLDTAGPEFYEGENSVRTETYSEAMELNRKIHLAWRNHPQRIVVSSQTEFLKKMTLGLEIIESVLKGLKYEDILKLHSQRDHEIQASLGGLESGEQLRLSPVEDPDKK